MQLRKKKTQYDSDPNKKKARSVSRLKEDQREMIRGQVRKLFRPTQAPSAFPLPFLGCTLILVV